MDKPILKYKTIMTSDFDNDEMSYKNIEYHLVYKKYNLLDPFEIIKKFENTIAEFFGAKYAISTDCCTHALELCLREISDKNTQIEIPNKTYWSVPMMISKIERPLKFKNTDWEYLHKLDPYPIWDAAMYWKKGGYIPGSLMCLSFQSKKHLPVGKGGMILLDDLELYKRLSKKRLDGLDISKFEEGEYYGLDIDVEGYHYYMHPRDAARGLLLFDELKDAEIKPWDINIYSDLTKFKVFNDIPKS